MLKAYKYKLLPNQDQTILLNKHFGSVRFAFNYFLRERLQEYKTNKQTLNYYDNSASLTLLKKDPNYLWLKEINSQSLQYSLKSLEAAYNNFFKGRAKFPRFKSKHEKNSFTIPQFVSLDKNGLNIPKFKDPIKVIEHRKLKGNIKQATISKTATNEYFVSILVETIHEPFSKTKKETAIDLGIKSFVITSENVKFKNHNFLKNSLRKLKRAQQHLARKTKNSNRYNKQKLKVANIHKKITNSRMDNLHKVSTTLIKHYDTIFLENLNVKGMIKNHKLARSIADASWGKFVELLTYKAEWNDKELVKINRFFPSSKSCSNCDYINQNLNLSIRQWTCPCCNMNHDRDHNAAKNILKEGYKILSLGTNDYRRGDEIRPSLEGTIYETSKILN